MKPTSQKLTTCAYFMLLIACSFSFELKPFSLDQNVLITSEYQSFESNLPTADCPLPQIFESIQNFTLPLKDVSSLLTNQYSHNTISNINAQNKVTLYSIVYSSHLLSNDQSESYLSPLRATVYNDQTEFVIDYKINITEGIIKKVHQFTAQTKVSKIAITYEKELSLSTDSFLINTATVKLDPSMMTTTYTPSPNKTEEESFDTAIKGTTESLYASLVKLLSNDQVREFMKSNTKNQPISKIYLTNPYNYNFQQGKKINVTIPIDVSTTWFKSVEKSLSNGMSGNLPNNKYCNSFVPDFATTGGKLFFSKEFIQNFIEYNVVSFAGWQNVQVDKTTVRSNILQWKLMDLDYIVDGLWRDLEMVYQNEIYFTCSAKENVATQLNSQETKIHQTLKWLCQGYVKLNETTSFKIMEFSPRINHIISLSISYSNELTPYVNPLKFIDCEFSEVKSLNGEGVYKVKESNLKLAQKLMESVFNDLSGYSMGERFWLGENSQRLKIDDDLKGLWVY